MGCNYSSMPWLPWASYQIRKIAGCACAGNAGNVFPRRRLQRKLLVSDPGMHPGTCVTHVPWCIPGSRTRSGGENVPGIPGACAVRDFAYLARGPWRFSLTGRCMDVTPTCDVRAEVLCVSPYVWGPFQQKTSMWIPITKIRRSHDHFSVVMEYLYTTDGLYIENKKGSAVYNPGSVSTRFYLANSF